MSDFRSGSSNCLGVRSHRSQRPVDLYLWRGVSAKLGNDFTWTITGVSLAMLTYHRNEIEFLELLFVVFDNGFAFQWYFREFIKRILTVTSDP